MSPPYPLSPTRCWRYHFSYLGSGGDCGLGRCKRPAEARCLPPSQSLRLGSRMLNPLLGFTQKYTSKKKKKGLEYVCKSASCRWQENLIQVQRVTSSWLVSPNQRSTSFLQSIMEMQANEEMLLRCTHWFQQEQPAMTSYKLTTQCSLLTDL